MNIWQRLAVVAGVGMVIAAFVLAAVPLSDTVHVPGVRGQPAQGGPRLDVASECGPRSDPGWRDCERRVQAHNRSIIGGTAAIPAYDVSDNCGSALFAKSDVSTKVDEVCASSIRSRRVVVFGLGGIGAFVAVAGGLLLACITRSRAPATA